MDKKKIETVDEYLEQFPPERRKMLDEMRRVIREAAPKAEERIRWGMPTYWQGENLVHFAYGKNHIGFYPSPEGITAFADSLREYKTSKGAIQLPVSRPIPYGLVADITRYRVKMVEGES